MANPASAIRAEVLARHPDAVLIERGLSHLRHQLPDLDGRHRFVLNAVIGALHYKDDKGAWQEIDDALEDDGADGFSVRTGATGHLLRMAADGKRRLYPNRYDITRYVEFSALPSVGTPQRGPNYLAWDRPSFAIKLFSYGTCVKFLFTLKDTSAPTSVSFNVALVGLTRSGRFLLADGVPVAEMCLPTAIDAAGTERDCTFTLSAGKVTIALDTSGLVFPIEIDPTVDVQVGASANDGYRAGATTWNATETNATIGQFGSTVCHAWTRWIGVTLAGTIGVSYISVYPYAAASGTPLRKIYGVDEDNPAASTTYQEFDADPLTTAGVDWDGVWTVGQWNQSGSLNSIFQELVGSYTISNDAVMLQIRDDGSAVSNYQAMRTWDYSGNLYGAKLYIEYSTGGAVLWGEAALAANGTLAASGKLIAKGTATLSGVGAMAAAGLRTAWGAATLSGAGSLTVAGNLIAKGSAALTGNGTLAAAGRLVAQGSAVLSGSGTLTAAGLRVVFGAATLAGSGSLTAAGRLIARGAAALSATGSLTATALGGAVAWGEAALGATGSLVAAGRLLAKGTASLSGVGTMTAVGLRVCRAAAALSGTGTMVAVGRRVLRGTANLSGVGTMTAVGKRLSFAAAALSGSGTLTAVGRALLSGRAVFQGTGTLVATAAGPPPTVIDLRGSYENTVELTGGDGSYGNIIQLRGSEEPVIELEGSDG